MATIPQDLQAFLEENVALLKTQLGDHLVGVYLHGSVAMGGFNPHKSDIDYLVIVDQPLSTDQKQRIGAGLVALAKDAPAKGIEMHIVTRAALKKFTYPTPFELHYSQMWHDQFANHQVDFVTQKYDGDLAAHLTVTRSRGVRLYGEPIDKVLPEIPPRFYQAAIVSDVQNAREQIVANPVYYILNLCRVLVYLQRGAVTSKIEAGNEGEQLIPPQYRPLVKGALDEYQEKGQPVWDRDELQQFADYMLGEIGRLAGDNPSREG
jgi:streptomycin 3"-adenylyltransferase